MEDYLSALYKSIKIWGGKINRPIDTIYIGGGTPSLLGESIKPLVECVKESFSVSKNAEITVEANPSGNIEAFLSAAYSAGVNRLSIGAQSGSEEQLKLLGRSHTKDETAKTVALARKIGFKNISLDLMIGLPQSDLELVKSDIDFITSLGPEHISAYILKLEKATALYHRRNEIRFADDDMVAQQYLYMCERLEAEGYGHYEISNFSVKGRESRHNLKYWRDEEYLGIGPAAHSYLDGERFYYPRDIKAFIKGNEPIFDGTGGEKEERLMLTLRLSEGVNLESVYNPIPNKIISYLKALEKAELVNLRLPYVSLTDKGMLVSNSIITELIL